MRGLIPGFRLFQWKNGCEETSSRLHTINQVIRRFGIENRLISHLTTIIIIIIAAKLENLNLPSSPLGTVSGSQRTARFTTDPKCQWCRIKGSQQHSSIGYGRLIFLRKLHNFRFDRSHNLTALLIFFCASSRKLFPKSPTAGLLLKKFVQIRWVQVDG